VAADNEATSWVESLSPWPKEGFGLARMEALLDALGHPEWSYPAIHVVGTNGKTTTTRVLAALLALEGLKVGAYTSPHATGWSERIQVGGSDVDFEWAIGEVREPAEEFGATQFEVLTGAALKAFAELTVDAAVVEAGLGGRLDATNVLRSPVQVLTNVSLEHTDVLGDTREAIATEKLAVVQAGATVVLGEPEWQELALAQGAGQVVVEGGGNAAIARAAAEAFLGRLVTHEVDVEIPGRFERRSPDEIWDGAHTPAGVDWLLGRLPRRGYVLCVSLLRDKDADGILRRLAAVGDTLVATSSSNDRALPAKELALRAEPYFEHVEAIDDPVTALGRAREHAAGGRGVLVTGSLYLLADLSRAV
jgi:dihydrofolate synthase / folylpolyglutamate synthase